MSRRRLVEEQVSHERWLVSYADFITLLFAFFVVMYSISQVNEGKYKVLSETLTQVFTDNVNVEAFNTSDNVDDLVLDIDDIQNPALESQQTITDDQQTLIMAAKMPEFFRRINERISQSFGDLVDQELLTVRGNEDWLELELQSSLLFPSGDAILSTGALELLGGIADALRDQPNPIRVEGFTDNVPINSVQFPSNWELSSYRAAAVVKLFIEEGLAPERLASVGYGEYQPVADNNSEEGREANRRVVLMVSNHSQLRPELRDITTTQELQDTAQVEDESSINRGIEIIIPGVNSETVEGDDDLSSPPDQTQSIDGVRTIELEGGGLLFTNSDLREGEVQGETNDDDPAVESIEQ